MKNKKTLILLIVLLPLLASKCGDNVFTPKPDQLPPITQTGKNTFGCLVNGDIYLPEKTLPFAPIIQTEFYNRKHISVLTGKKGNESLSLYIQIFNLNNLQSLDSSLIQYFDFGSENYSNCIFESSTQNTNIVHLSKLDTINRIVAGTFEADLVDDDDTTCTNIIHITEGRFDVRY